jgi:hypothetical protein
MLSALYEDPRRRFHPTVPDPGLMAQLRRIIAPERSQIIQTHGWSTYSALALKRGDVPKIVMTLHDHSLVCAKRALLRDGEICAGPAYRKCLACTAAHSRRRRDRTARGAQRSGCSSSSHRTAARRRDPSGALGRRRPTARAPVHHVGGHRRDRAAVLRSGRCLTRSRRRLSPGGDRALLCKIANVSRHKDLPVLRRYIRAATAFDDVGKVL